MSYKGVVNIFEMNNGGLATWFGERDIFLDRLFEESPKITEHLINCNDEPQKRFWIAAIDLDHYDLRKVMELTHEYMQELRGYLEEERHHASSKN